MAFLDKYTRVGSKRQCISAVAWDPPGRAIVDEDLDFTISIQSGSEKRIVVLKIELSIIFITWSLKLSDWSSMFFGDEVGLCFRLDGEINKYYVPPLPARPPRRERPRWFDDEAVPV